MPKLREFLNRVELQQLTIALETASCAKRAASDLGLTYPALRKLAGKHGVSLVAMRKQRGSILLYGLLALAVIASLAGLYAWVDGNGYKRGASTVRGEWDAAMRIAQGHEVKRAAEIGREIARVDENRLVAERAADKATLNWQEAVRESKRNQVALGVCDAAPASVLSAGADTRLGGDMVGSGITADGSALRLRLTHEFVHHFDAAWVGLAGQSVFPAPARGTGPTGPSAIGIEDLLAVHGANAQRCSEDRREFKALIERIRAAGAAFDKTNGKGP